MIEFYEIMDLRFTGYVLSHGLFGGNVEASWGIGDPEPRQAMLCMFSGKTVIDGVYIVYGGRL